MSKRQREIDHKCHARGCPMHVKPEMLMCRRHWYMVPNRIREAVWASYRPGQCDDMSPSVEWHQAADAAIGFVAAKEGQKLRMAEVNALNAPGYETYEERGLIRARFKRAS